MTLKLQGCRQCTNEGVLTVIVQITDQHHAHHTWLNVCKNFQSQLMEFLLSHDFLTCDQSAFRKGHSTETALRKIRAYYSIVTYYLIVQTRILFPVPVILT